LRIPINEACPVNLDATLCCGQAFRWDRKGDWWFGIVGDKVCRIRQIDNELEFENADVDLVRSYFRLDDDLPKIFSQIGKDKYSKHAIQEFAGLRILNQDPSECLISYICATYKSIAAIKRMLSELSAKFGDKILCDGQSFHTFPTLAKLAKATVRELTSCGLGYRAKHVAQTARILEGGDLEVGKLKETTYEQAKTKLLSLPGVGPKAADCVLLFSLGKLEAFPVDVWIRRVILRHYRRHFPTDFIRKISERKSLSNSEYKRLSSFGRKYFGEYAGYAQEYLYHYERTCGKHLN
jgi:N-glycosylase/DNA lyase